MQSFIADRVAFVMQKRSQPAAAVSVAEPLTEEDQKEKLNSLNHDFNSLAKDFKHLKQQSKDFGKGLNRAFQRLIYLLADADRLAIMRGSPWILTKTSGKACLDAAAGHLTEKQK